MFLHIESIFVPKYYQKWSRFSNMKRRWNTTVPQSPRKTFHDGLHIFPIISRDSNCLPPFLRFIPRKGARLAAAKPKNHPQPTHRSSTILLKGTFLANEVKAELRKPGRTAAPDSRSQKGEKHKKKREKKLVLWEIDFSSVLPLHRGAFPEVFFSSVAALNGVGGCGCKRDSET